MRENDDQKAFESLIDHYFSWLFSVGLNILKKREVVEEIIEDVFFKIWQIRDRTNEISNLDTYLYVAVRNHCYDQLRKDSRKMHISLDGYEKMDDVVPPDQILLMNELRDHVDKAINNLPKRCRQIFELVRLQQMSYKKAATTLGISPKTVENQLGIAMKKLIKDLENYISVSK